MEEKAYLARWARRGRHVHHHGFDQIDENAAIFASMKPSSSGACHGNFARYLPPSQLFRRRRMPLSRLLRLLELAPFS